MDWKITVPQRPLHFREIRNGLGSLSIEKVFELAREKNCKKVKWMMSKCNNNTIKFYERKGAEIDLVEIPCEYLFDKTDF